MQGALSETHAEAGHRSWRGQLLRSIEATTALSDTLFCDFTTVKMLLLDYQNVLIQSVLAERFSG